MRARSFEYGPENSDMNSLNTQGLEAARTRANSPSSASANQAPKLSDSSSVAEDPKDVVAIPKGPAEQQAGQAGQVSQSSDASFQKYKRLGTNASLLVLGDVPAGISVAVGLDALPALTPYSPVINAVNSLTGYLGLASDISVARDCLNNPDASRVDKLVDAAHIGSDLINTGSSMVPLFTSLNNPIALGIFIGGQAFGAVCDMAKTAWDLKRGGGQSARSDADQPQRLVLDAFEQKAGRLPVLVGAIAANSIAFPSAHHVISMTAAAPLSAIGGAFGAVYGYTQIKKANEMRGLLEQIKAEGVDNFEMPHWEGSNLKTTTVKVDKAIAETKLSKWAGIGQTFGSALLMAAGCTACPPLAIAGLIVTTGTGVAATATHLYLNREEVKEKVTSAYHTVQEKVHNAKEKVVQFVTRSIEPKEEVAETPPEPPKTE